MDKSCQNCKNLYFNDIYHRYECHIKAKKGEVYEAWTRLIGRPVEKYCDVFNPAVKNHNRDCQDFRWKPLCWLFRRQKPAIRAQVWDYPHDKMADIS